MKKQRVVTRSKVRFQRRKRNGAVLALAVLAVLGAGVVRTLRRGGHSPREFLDAPRVRSVSVEGASSAERGGVEAALAAYVGRPMWPVSVDAVAAELSPRFPTLRVERVEKVWTRLALRVTLAPRTALARCAEAARRGAPVVRFLDDAGEVFPAPDAAAQAGLPAASGVCAGTPQARTELASLLSAWNGADHAGLSLSSTQPEPGGWVLFLDDGTRLRWGGASQTPAKLRRLQQALADGRGRYGGVASVDLRFFDEGKVLIVPAAAHKPAAGTKRG